MAVLYGSRGAGMALQSMRSCPRKPGQGAWVITFGDGEILVGVTLATGRSCALASLCVPGTVLLVLSWL